MNAVLQEHLGKATEVNSALKEDVGKLTADWMRAREELELKESEWRNECEVRIGYGNVRRDAQAEWEGILFLARRTCCVKVVAALRTSWCCLAKDRGVRWRRVSKSWCWKTPPPAVTILLSLQGKCLLLLDAAGQSDVSARPFSSS